jgi:hypothetical protein
MVQELLAEAETLLSPHLGCAFSIDCGFVSGPEGCATACPSPVHLSKREEVRELLAGLYSEHCPEIAERSCRVDVPSCDSSLKAICRAGRCVAAADAELDEAIVPPENQAGVDEPPPRPQAGDAQERAERLFSAIVRDDPSIAADFFFPQEAFRKVKAIPNPDRYWHRLFSRYARDIHELHARFDRFDPDTLHFDHLEIVRRGGFMRRGEEGNALPYWAARHNWLHFSRGGVPDKFEVRVLITWGNRWYITHLSEFH